jgi:hypothetical protein
MTRYRAVSGLLFKRTQFIFQTDCTLKLRQRCREHLGLRRSAKMRYRKIGANSYRVETKRGRVVLDVFKEAA